jgi:hypothetical protein
LNRTPDLDLKKSNSLANMLQQEIVNNLFETTEIQDRVFEKKTWTETPAQNFTQDQHSQPAKLIFSSYNLRDNYLLVREGYIEFQLHFKRKNGAAFVATDRYAIRNHVLSLFDNIEIQISDADHKIEELRYLEHWANINFLLKWSNEYADSFGEESLFSKDFPLALGGKTLTDDAGADSFDASKASANKGLIVRSSYVKSHQAIVTLYLKDLPFFNSYHGIFTKARFRLILTPNYHRPLVYAIAAADAGTAEGMNYKLSRANMYIPEVTLMNTQKLSIIKKFNDGFTKIHKWMSIDPYQSSQFAANTTNIQYTISTEIRKPNWVYIVLCPDYTEDEYPKKLTQIYNTWNITSYSLLINNKEAFNESNISFLNLKAHRLYNYMKQNMSQSNDRESLNSGCQISYLDFCNLYRILCFCLDDVDATSIYNSRADNTVSIVFKATVNVVNKPLVIYSFIEREKEICFNYKNDSVEISLNSL